jgi:3-hydroxyisobutyrate dehydrogenase-like beta-hydroxyacid dehydrogenase
MDWPWKHGNPMVQNLLKAGFEVVFNRTKTRKRTNSVRTFWSQSTSVTNLRHGNYHVINDAAVKEIFESENGCYLRIILEITHQYEYRFS